MTGQADPESRRWRWIAATLLVAAGVAATVVVRNVVSPDGSATAGIRAETDEPRFDSPDQAMEWILMSYRDDQGNIPRDGLMRARARVDVMRRASREQAQRGEASGSIAAAAISNSAWTWLGPINIGGRVRALVVLPDAVTLITGGVAGGIWKSSNAGSSWRVIDDFMANLAVSTIVYRPGQPSRLFAGTGEGFFNADSIRGAGIFASTDEGESWSQLPSTANVDFDFVNRLAFSADGNVLLAATRTGLFRSADLGGSWTKVLDQASVLDVKFMPGSNALAVASTRSRTALRSTNGGVTWTNATGLLASGSAIRVELAVSVSSPNIVYASVDENSGQIWKSTDGGASYAKISDPAHLSTQGWYDNALWVDPTNPDLVMAGGVSLFRSTNGGVSFSTATNCHVDQHIIVHDPGYNGTSNRRVYFGSDGGVCRMEDVTVNAVTSLRNGLGITQFYGGGGHGAAGRVMGGTQDNGTLLYNVSSGTTAWSVQFGSDGGFSVVDPSNPNILYGETQNFRIHRSLTGGTPSQYIYGGSGSTSCSKPVPFQLTDACSGFSNFIAPFILDPNEPNRLLAGGRSLWRSDDPRTPNAGTTGPSWGAIKPPTSTNSNISAIAVAPGNSDLIWVGHNSGDVYVTANGTSLLPTWTRVDGAVLPNRVINSIAVDPTDARIVYVAFGGFSPDSLWRTTNLGATWQDQTGSGATGLPDAPIRSVVLHPQVADWVYAASDVGLFASEDGGTTWSLPHDGPANVAVFQLFWMDSTLVAVTHGRGMFSAPAASDSPAFARRPRSQAVISGHSVTFNPVALGIGPLSFQWYRGQSGDTSQPIIGATSVTFSTGAITQTRSFWVRVTNALGSVDSNTATLTILAWGTLLPGTTNQSAAPIIGEGTAGTGSSTAGATTSRTSAATSSASPASASSTPGAAGSAAVPLGPSAAFAPSRAAAAAVSPSMASGGRISMPYASATQGPTNSIPSLGSIGPIGSGMSIGSTTPVGSTSEISRPVVRDATTGYARLTDSGPAGDESARPVAATSAPPAPLTADAPPPATASIDSTASIEQRAAKAVRTPEAAAVTAPAPEHERAPGLADVDEPPSRLLPAVIVVLGLLLPPIAVGAWIRRKTAVDKL